MLLIQNIENEIRALDQAKEEAIAMHDFEKATSFRDKLTSLQKKYGKETKEFNEKEKPLVVTREWVEQTISYFSGISLEDVKVRNPSSLSLWGEELS